LDEFVGVLRVGGVSGLVDLLGEPVGVVLVRHGRGVSRPAREQLAVVAVGVGDPGLGVVGCVHVEAPAGGAALEGGVVAAADGVVAGGAEALHPEEVVVLAGQGALAPAGLEDRLGERDRGGDAGGALAAAGGLGVPVDEVLAPALGHR